ncbi:MAG: NTP transferase domain-containing protein [Piscinibacter sp.]|uniref:cytidylyltransferase domain-containing protein n=1 Tax=Piscinibacter sp. TaxID=1903157 RepID=UPI003D0CD4FC
MTTAIIVQARMGSSRLPGKVLLPIEGRPMLSYQLERLRAVERADVIVVATSTSKADDPIDELCCEEGVSSVRGPELDVLSRYEKAAAACGASAIVRVTADCPLIDPDLIDESIRVFRESPDKPDFVSNMLQPTWPYGMAVEVFSRRCLAEANAEATDPDEREHVTPFIWRRPDRYRLRSLTREPDLSRHRWTVDTPEDFELISRILGKLAARNADFRLEDVLAVLRRNPSWENLNRHVAQRAVAHASKEA